MMTSAQMTSLISGFVLLIIMGAFFLLHTKCAPIMKDNEGQSEQPGNFAVAIFSGVIAIVGLILIIRPILVHMPIEG